MKALKVVAMVLGVILLLGAAGVAYLFYRIRHLPDTHDLEHQVDELAQKTAADEGIPVLMVAVVKNGTIHSGTYGTADPGPGPDAIYEIGSITKVFTTLMVQRLVDQGRLKWDDPITRFFPEGSGPRTDDGTTLLHLATHTSGYPRLPAAFIDAVGDDPDPYSKLTFDDLLHMVSTLDDKHPPSADRVEYSNLGMGLLAHLMEMHEGMPYDDLLATHITGPLGLEMTRTTVDQAYASWFLEGHDEEGRPTPHWNFGALQGAGALRSTSSDMVRFLKAAVEKDPVLGHAWDACYQLRVKTTDGGVGLGWQIDRWSATLFNMPRILWHNGSTGGFSSYIGIVPEAGFGVVVLANRAAGHAVDKLGRDLLLRANHISFASAD